MKSFLLVACFAFSSTASAQYFDYTVTTNDGIETHSLTDMVYTLDGMAIVATIVSASPEGCKPEEITLVLKTFSAGPEVKPAAKLVTPSTYLSMFKEVIGMMEGLLTINYSVTLDPFTIELLSEESSSFGGFKLENMQGTAKKFIQRTNVLTDC